MALVLGDILGWRENNSENEGGEKRRREEGRGRRESGEEVKWR